MTELRRESGHAPFAGDVVLPLVRERVPVDLAHVAGVHLDQRWAVGELGIPHERDDIGMEFGGNDTPTYRIMNSNGLAPTIQDGNFVLWESNSIIRYLAAHCGPGTLEPRRPSQRSTGERDIQSERLYSLQLADERICRYLYGSGEKNRVARMQTNE